MTDATAEPLTEAQRGLVLMFSYEEVKHIVTRHAAKWFRVKYGIDECVQECWIAVINAAKAFRPDEYPDVPFKAYATNGMKMRIRGRVDMEARRACVWLTMSALRDRHGHEVHEDSLMADFRRDGSEFANPALSIWHDEEYRMARAILDTRARIMLYLHSVERWTFREIGEAFGLVKQRTQQIVDRAISDIALKVRALKTDALFLSNLDSERPAHIKS